MAKTETITLTSHKLSLHTGVYIITFDGKAAAICTTKRMVEEYLGDIKYADAHKVAISLAGFDDLEADDITHLYAWDMMDDYRTYAEFETDQGYCLPWLEFWFDEIEAAEFVRDIKRRQDRLKEIMSRPRADEVEAFRIAAE